jgi:hypothetical protein
VTSKQHTLSKRPLYDSLVMKMQKMSPHQGSASTDKPVDSVPSKTELIEPEGKPRTIVVALAC